MVGLHLPSDDCERLLPPTGRSSAIRISNIPATNRTYEKWDTESIITNCTLWRNPCRENDETSGWRRNWQGEFNVNIVMTDGGCMERVCLQEAEAPAVPYIAFFLKIINYLGVKITTIYHVYLNVLIIVDCTLPPRRIS